MTRFSLFSLLGWSLAGGAAGAGLLVGGLPPIAVALVLAGVGLFAATYRASGVIITSAAAIVALSPGILPSLPVWASLFIATVLYLIVCDLTVRLN